VERNTRDIFEGNNLVFAYVHNGIPRKPLLCVEFTPAGFRTGDLPNIGLVQSCWVLCSYELSINQNCLLAHTFSMSLMRNIVETDK